MVQVTIDLLFVKLYLYCVHYQGTQYSQDKEAIGWTLYAQIFEIVLVKVPVDNNYRHRIGRHLEIKVLF